MNRYIVGIVGIVVCLFAGLALIGCGDDPVMEYEYIQSLGLPTDYAVSFVHADEGIHPNKSVLQDPNNMFIKSPITTNVKWGIEDGSSAYPKARFYMWATLLVREPWGEPQFYVGKALKDLFEAATNSAYSNYAPSYSNQAFRAFFSVIENFWGQKVLSAGGALERVEANAAAELKAMGVKLENYGYTLNAYGELLRNE